MKTLGQVAYDNATTAVDLPWAFLEDWQQRLYERAAAGVVAAHEARRWMPISEAHEDHGVCAFINIHDPEPICASTMDDDFAEMAKHYGWTHFCRITLTHEDAARLIAELPAPPKEAA